MRVPRARKNPVAQLRYVRSPLTKSRSDSSQLQRRRQSNFPQHQGLAAATRPQSSERNVVVHPAKPASERARLRRRGRSRACSRRRAGSGAGRSVVAAGVVTGGRAHALAAAQHLHLVHAHFSAVLELAVLALPLAGADAAFDVNLVALAQVLPGDLGQLAVEYQAVPLSVCSRGSPLCLSRHLSVVARVTLATWSPLGKVRISGVAPQVADEDDFVDGGHGVVPAQG